MRREDVDALIVGAGPAGLAAAVELRRLGVPRVLVLERERELGGIPRHCHHTGFGLLDLHRVVSGPAYARRWTRLLEESGAESRLETTALGWSGPTALKTTGPNGLREISAKAVLLATGCRERPRAARLVPGSRPRGVLTTGALQQLVYFNKRSAGTRAVVVGAEHVSFSAVHTLTSSGTEVAAMVTGLPAHQSFAAFRWLTASLHRVPILCGAAVTDIRGRERVEAVEVALASGEKRAIPCDTVVFTGDWIPDHELARARPIALDPATRGPAVDAGLRTGAPGVFAAGNLLRGAETADVAALEGRAAARSMAAFLRDGFVASPDAVPISVEAPLLWICPNILSGNELPPRGRFILRASSFVKNARVEVRQAGRRLHEQEFGLLVPNRPISLDAAWAARARASDGPITVSLA